MRRYQDVALRTAYLVCPETDADDAVQEAFLKAYAALPRFRDGAPFRPWLLRIVANEARNRRRSAGRRTGLAQRAADVAGPAVEPSPEHDYLAAEERDGALRGDRHAARRGPRGDRRAVPARAERSGDRRGPGRPARDGQVSNVAGAGPAARGARRSERGDPWLSSASSSCPTTSWAPRCVALLRPSRGRMRGSRLTARTSRRGSARGSSRRHRHGAVRRGACDPRLCSQSSRCSCWPRWPARWPSASRASG